MHTGYNTPLVDVTATLLPGIIECSKFNRRKITLVNVLYYDTTNGTSPLSCANIIKFYQVMQTNDEKRFGFGAFFIQKGIERVL